MALHPIRKLLQERYFFAVEVVADVEPDLLTASTVVQLRVSAPSEKDEPLFIDGKIRGNSVFERSSAQKDYADFVAKVVAECDRVFLALETDR